MNLRELKEKLQEEGLLEVFRGGMLCKYVSGELLSQAGRRNNMAGVYGIFKDDDAYYVFFSDNEQAPASHAAGYKSEEEACDKLYEELIKQDAIHRSDVLNYLESYLCKEMGLEEKTGNELCAVFQRNFDIAEEFWKIQKQYEFFAPGSGIHVRGYTASELFADYAFSTLDAYSFLIALREEPWAALARLRDEHPETTKPSFCSTHAFKEKLRKEELLSIYIGSRLCHYVDEDQVIHNGKWHNLADVYGIYQTNDDEAAYYVFFTDYERGIVTYRSRQKTMEDACNKLYQCLLMKLEIHRKEVMADLNYAFSRYFLIEDIKHYKKRADDMCENLERHFDIAEELWITLDCKGFPIQGHYLTVRGYSAEKLYNNYNLDVLGAYNYLIFLREEPMRALELLKKGLPRK